MNAGHIAMCQACRIACPHTTEIFITLLNLVSYNVPLLITLFSPDNQFFSIVEEAEWAVEVTKATGKPVGITMCIGVLVGIRIVYLQETVLSDWQEQVFCC